MENLRRRHAARSLLATAEALRHVANHSPAARTMHKINLAEKFSQFSTHWSPKIVAELNGQHAKLVKFQGEFVWHHHEHEDELFLVVRGAFRMEFRDRTVELREGELLSCRAAWSTGRWRTRRSACCCSNPRRR
jgi:mannose-6-phosphate isomerase-like protein (cupin superfamily)